jgi:serine/threonine protein kinase
MFSSDFDTVKLIDLGIAEDCMDQTKKTDSAECGTTRYNAPEKYLK